MFEEILKESGGRLLIPVVIAFAFATFAKALFALHRSLGSERKDFLELWPQQRLLDDLWLEVTIRHFAGTYLPAPVIRDLLGAAHPSRALLDVSECWELLELETESGGVRWKVRRYADPARRAGEARLLGAIYYVMTGPALLLAYLLVSVPTLPTTYWGIVVLLLILGVSCLLKSDTLKKSVATAPRWLGLP